MSTRKTYIASIDQGTSSTRVILYESTHLEPITSKQLEYHLNTPQPGWVDADPMILLSTTRDCLNNVIDDMIERDPSFDVSTDLLTIGITNQRETTILWDKITGKPFYNALIWLDTRTSSVVDELLTRFDVDLFRPLCGLPISTYFSAVKIKWILENVEEAQVAVANDRCYFGTVDTWLIWNLTGEFVTDVTNASRTMLMNLETLDWDDHLLEALEIPRSILPPIKNSADFFGKMKDPRYNDIPINGCIGDQQASLVGNLCFTAGSAKNTLGTGAFLLYNTGDKPIQSQANLITSIGYKFGDDLSYVLEGSIATVGAALNWMQDSMGLIDSPKNLAQLSSETNGGVYFVPALSGLFAPYWRNDTQGTIMGMTMNTEKSHVIRALVESFAFRVHDIIKCMETDSGVSLLNLRCDGGLSKSDFVLQNQSDILNITVERPSDVESTARGAAISAGIGLGLWTKEQISDQIAITQTCFSPSITTVESDKLIQGWEKAVAACLFYADSKK